jgi:catechol 2,3-dioxygenase-like lactoylglutathione lyase family enzyme
MLLLDHVSIGVPDLDAARPFYDAIMDALGPRKVYDRPDAVGYGERCSASDIQSSCLAVYLDPGPVQPGPDVHRSSGLDERPAAFGEVDRFRERQLFSVSPYTASKEGASAPGYCEGGGG